jgi:hypothetical protein
VDHPVQRDMRNWPSSPERGQVRQLCVNQRRFGFVFIAFRFSAFSTAHA